MVSGIFRERKRERGTEKSQLAHKMDAHLSGLSLPQFLSPFPLQHPICFAFLLLAKKDREK